MGYCPECGKELEEKSDFCSNCGNKINPEAQVLMNNKINKHNKMKISINN